MVALRIRLDRVAANGRWSRLAAWARRGRFSLRGTAQPNPDKHHCADNRDRRVHGLFPVGAFRSRCARPVSLSSAGREATSGTVTWRDTVWPGERLLSSRPVGNSWTDHGWAPFARCAALGAASIGIQHQAIWRASIVRPGPTGAIGRTTELCTEFAAV